jgi:hypothetical protein
MGRPSTVTESMEDFIRAQLRRQPRPTAYAISQNLAELFEGKVAVLPSEDAVIKRVTKLRREVEETPPNPLDSPWNIGASMKYEIPADATPLLIRLKPLLKDPFFTVRVAKWISLLFPALKPLVERHFSQDSYEQDKRYVFIPVAYANREQVNESKGEKAKDCPDTMDMDVLFFKYGDVSEMALVAAVADTVNSGFWDKPWLHQFVKPREGWLASALSQAGDVPEPQRRIVAEIYEAYAKSQVSLLLYIKHEHPENWALLFGEPFEKTEQRMEKDKKEPPENWALLFGEPFEKQRIEKEVRQHERDNC